MRIDASKFVWVLLAGVPIASAGDNGPLRAFNVRDSIGMTVLADPDVTYLGATSYPEVKRSSDGRHFLVVTRRGDIARGCNEYQLSLYDTAAVLLAVESGVPPESKVLETFCTASNRAGISRVKWVSNDSIAFLGENPNTSSQLFEMSLSTGITRQLTHHPTPVISYDIGTAESFVYIALAREVDWGTRRLHGYVVGAEPFFDIVGEGNTELFPRAAFFIGHRHTSSYEAVDESPDRVVDGSSRLWMSPTGRWAIAVHHTGHVPQSWWSEYAPIKDDGIVHGASQQGASDFVGESPEYFLQYALIDVQAGHLSALIDAPTGYSFGGLELSAHWLLGERGVILANTFLPIEGVSATEAEARKTAPAVAEVDLDGRVSSRILSIRSMPWQLKDATGQFVASRLSANGDVLSIKLSGEHGYTWRYFRRSKSGWERVSHIAHERDELLVGVSQSLNQAPELLATNPITRHSRVISDFNPEIRSVSFGSFRTIEWTDPSGRAFHGGLIEPVGSDRSKRYPLVIQTHGYRPDGFIDDGPFGFTGGYAARELANRGIAVLQMADQVPAPDGQTEDLQASASRYKSAISMLAAQGLVDTRRVGIQGFSGTGRQVEYALVFSDIDFAVGTVADASELSVYQYPMWYGMFYPGMMEMERFIGSDFWGDRDRKVWAENDPTFHLDRLHAPLLIQDYEGSFTWFDIFARLKRHHMPVEFMAFPGAAHVLFQPLQRLNAQQSLVDWYDFWLNGREDADPAKATQYTRWEGLCRLQRQENPGRKIYCVSNRQ